VGTCCRIAFQWLHVHEDALIPPQLLEVGWTATITNISVIESKIATLGDHGHASRSYKCCSASSICCATTVNSLHPQLQEYTNIALVHVITRVPWCVIGLPCDGNRMCNQTSLPSIRYHKQTGTTPQPSLLHSHQQSRSHVSQKLFTLPRLLQPESQLSVLQRESISSGHTISYGLDCLGWEAGMARTEVQLMAAISPQRATCTLSRGLALDSLS
jgi:hypothetical protein